MFKTFNYSIILPFHRAVSKISEFTALVKDEDGFSTSKKMKMSSNHIVSITMLIFIS